MRKKHIIAALTTVTVVGGIALWGVQTDRLPMRVNNNADVNRTAPQQSNRPGDITETRYGLFTSLSNGDSYAFVKSMGVTFYRKGFFRPDIEKSQGRYDWSATDREFQKAKAAGLEIHPILWNGAQSQTKHKDYSEPPQDLRDIEDASFGYSRGYYDFVYAFVSRYKDQLTYLVIENEADSQRFFGGNADQYIRMLKTAYKAAHAASPNIRVTDSGMTNSAWGYLIASDALTEKRWTNQEALQWMQEYFTHFQPEDTLRRMSADDLSRYIQEPEGAAKITDLKQMMQDIPTTVDVLNFHFYSDEKFLDDVIAYIKNNASKKGKPAMSVITNELGDKVAKSAIGKNMQDVASEMTQKLRIATTQDLEAVIIFNANPEGEFGKLGYVSLSDTKGALNPVGQAVKDFIASL